jgi:hypothetical protein
VKKTGLVIKASSRRSLDFNECCQGGARFKYPSKCSSVVFYVNSVRSNELKMQQPSSSPKRSDPCVEPIATSSNLNSGSSSNQIQTDEVIGDRRLDPVPQPHSPSKIRKLKCRIIFWALMAPFTAFLSQYFYQVLLVEHPHVGILFFSPTNTNLVITIFAQVLAQLIQALFIDIFDVLRWQLASRERGVSILSYLQLSGATRWLGVLCLAVIGGSHHIWGIHR